MDTADDQPEVIGVAAVGQVAAVHGNYGVGALLNGAVGGIADMSQQPQYANLVPLGEGTPIYPLSCFLLYSYTLSI